MAVVFCFLTVFVLDDAHGYFNVYDIFLIAGAIVLRMFFITKAHADVTNQDLKGIVR